MFCEVDILTPLGDSARVTGLDVKRACEESLLVWLHEGFTVNLRIVQQTQAEEDERISSLVLDIS
jgi:hypothetical protein